MSTDLCIHASINSLITYKLEGLETFCFHIQIKNKQATIFIYIILQPSTATNGEGTH